MPMAINVVNRILMTSLSYIVFSKEMAVLNIFMLNNLNFNYLSFL